MVRPSPMFSLLLVAVPASGFVVAPAALSSMANRDAGLALGRPCGSFTTHIMRESGDSGDKAAAPRDDDISRLDFIQSAVFVGLGVGLGRILPSAGPETTPNTPPVASESQASDKAKREVLKATDVWLSTVTSGLPDAPTRTASLYAKDAVLWGTVSEQLRVTPQEIEDYFEYFARLPKLRVSAYKPNVRVLGDSVINDGYYVFNYEGEDGPHEKKARFSFVFRQSPEGKWLIEDHHSSGLPQAPTGLTPAATVVLN